MKGRVIMNLVIAEKPSVARSIAKVIGATTKHDGYLEGPAGPGDLRLGPTGAERRPEYLVIWWNWQSRRNMMANMKNGEKKTFPSFLRTGCIRYPPVQRNSFRF